MPATKKRGGNSFHFFRKYWGREEGRLLLAFVQFPESLPCLAHRWVYRYFPLSQSNGPHDLLALGLKILPPSPLHCRCANYCCQLPPQVGLWGLGSVFVTRPVFGFWNDGVRSTCMRYSMSCQERTQKWLIPNGRIFQYDKKIISRPLRKKQFKTFCDKVSFWSLLKFDNPVNLIFSCVSDHSASKVAFGDPPFFSRLICQFRTGGTCLVS